MPTAIANDRFRNDKDSGNDAPKTRRSTAFLGVGSGSSPNDADMALKKTIAQGLTSPSRRVLAEDEEAKNRLQLAPSLVGRGLVGDSTRNTSEGSSSNNLLGRPEESDSPAAFDSPPTGRFQDNRRHDVSEDQAERGVDRGPPRVRGTDSRVPAYDATTGHSPSDRLPVHDPMEPASQPNPTEQQKDDEEVSCNLFGFDFSKRRNQAVALSFVLMLVGLLVAILFAANAIGPGSGSPTPPVSATTPMTDSPTPQPAAQPATAAPAPPSSVSQWIQVGNDIDGETPNEFSGWSVAMSSNGTVVAIGAPSSDGGGIESGRVRIYVFSGETWTKLGASIDGRSRRDKFGTSVSLSANGMVLAVGANLADGINGIDSGEVRAYRWNGALWEDLGTPIEAELGEERFGSSVALSDDAIVLAVSASRNDGGQVRVFHWTGSDWAQRGSTIKGALSGDRFVPSVALSSDGSILACSGDKNNGREEFVQVFRWNSTAWIPQGSSLNSLGQNDVFGKSVALAGSGTVVAIGADVGNYCVVYGHNGTDWFQIGQTIHGVGEGDRFGSDVALSLSGDILVVGARWNDSNGSASGHALVYRLTSDREWIQVGQELVGEAEADGFGFSLSISDAGTRIAIGGEGNDGGGSSAGHVRVFDLRRND